MLPLPHISFGTQTLEQRYFRLAAELGDPDAQQELAFCLANGKGCKKDRKEAAKWYRAAVRSPSILFSVYWPQTDGHIVLVGCSRRQRRRPSVDIQGEVPMNDGILRSLSRQHHIPIHSFLHIYPCSGCWSCNNRIRYIAANIALWTL